MSKGPGRVERGIIDALTYHAIEGEYAPTAQSLAFAVFDVLKPTESQERSVRRALRYWRARPLLSARASKKYC